MADSDFMTSTTSRGSASESSTTSCEPSESVSVHTTTKTLAYLVAEAWTLSLGYDPSVGQKFSTYARHQPRLRFVDWLRTKLGRTRWSQSDRGRVERPRRELLSLDGFLDETGELVGGIRAGTLDTPFSRDPALDRLLSDSSREGGGVKKRELDALLSELAAELER